MFYVLNSVTFRAIFKCNGKIHIQEALQVFHSPSVHTLHPHCQRDVGVFLDHTFSRARPHLNMCDNNININNHAGNRECEHAEGELYKGGRSVPLCGVCFRAVVAVRVYSGFECDQDIWWNCSIAIGQKNGTE